MPFASRRQQRAAFGGHIPGISPAKAHEWAEHTDFSKLPDRAPAEKGKPTLRSKTSARLPKHLLKHLSAAADDLRNQMQRPDKITDAGQAVYREHSRREKSAAVILDGFMKLAFALPGPGKIMKSPSRHIGSFKGVATQNFLKAPGQSASTYGVNNPRRSLTSAISAFKASPKAQ